MIRLICLVIAHIIQILIISLIIINISIIIIVTIIIMCIIITIIIIIIIITIIFIIIIISSSSSSRSSSLCTGSKGGLHALQGGLRAVARESPLGQLRPLFVLLAFCVLLVDCV